MIPPTFVIILGKYAKSLRKIEVILRILYHPFYRESSFLKKHLIKKQDTVKYPVFRIGLSNSLISVWCSVIQILASFTC